MKFFVPALFFSSLVFSAAIDLEPTTVELAPRDTKSILGAIAAIQSNVATLTSSVSAFQGDTADALNIAVQSQTLDKSIQDGTSTVNNSTKLNDSGSSKVSQAILNFEPKVFKLLKLITAKKPQFDKVFFGGGSLVVLQNLQQEKKDTDAFGAAITSKLSPTYAQLAPAQIKKIDAAFDKAIAAYQPF